ncbi:hypothetical protein [Ellagibacter isourolithinifaciens]|uniref:hypothetical protein n=1 Tax=Ellagibacter isourolithinifaciens TaxID=2137581 RepID=UPI003FD89BDD
MVLVVHDPERGDLRELLDFELDLAFGSDENAFELTCAEGLAPAEGQLVFVDGSEYGGVVDEASYEAGREATGTVTCKGRTWHGVLAGKRLLPDSGSGYLSVSGKAGDVLASLVGRMGLSGLFSAAPDDTAVSYTFERFCDGYSGLKALAKANGRKVAMRRKGGKVEISLPPAVDYASKVDSDLLDFTLTSVHRCVNHLVCAGTGELEDRAVVHFYADAAGNVSHTQSLFGVDEIAALYDYSNADEEKLEEEGRKKLQEYQTQGSVEVEAHDDIDVDVGDVISARDNAHGRTVTATVAKKIVNVSRGVATYSYEVGSETTTKTSSSGTAESSGGGHAYLAGKGLSLDGYTFSAEVDAAALAAVESKAVAAEKGASDAAAAAGEASESAAGAASTAEEAAAAADANKKAIAGKQDKLTAGANVTIDGATISAEDTTYDEATPSKAGLMSAADKDRLDKAIKSGDELMTTNPFTPGSTLYISKIDNALYAADKRFNVSGKMISGDGAETELSAVNLAAPFAGDYEKQVIIQPGSTMVLRIRFDNQYYGQFPGYPYGYIIISFYFALGPKSVTVRAYNAYEPQGTGWKTLDGEKMSSSSYRLAWRFRNKYYGIQEFEVTIEGAASGSEGRTSLSQIEMHLDRPYSGRNPFLSKYAAEELYYPLTAPKFIGNLQGTADAAKTADKATTASSADSAATADRLKTARKVAIAGAVNGSATWDGSGDLAITVTGDSAAAGFLAAHPVGFYAETSGADPNDYGGTWERAPSVGPHTWLRTK